MFCKCKVRILLPWILREMRRVDKMAGLYVVLTASHRLGLGLCFSFFKLGNFGF